MDDKPREEDLPKVTDRAGCFPFETLPRAWLEDLRVLGFSPLF